MAKELIKKEDVLDVAKLSRLEFSDTEIEGIKKDLGEIVAYFGVLNAVDTTGIPAVRKPEGDARADVAKQSLPVVEVIKNAPEKNYNSFVVPKVVE